MPVVYLPGHTTIQCKASRIDCEIIAESAVFMPQAVDLTANLPIDWMLPLSASSRAKASRHACRKRSLASSCGALAGTVPRESVGWARPRDHRGLASFADAGARLVVRTLRRRNEGHPWFGRRALAQLGCSLRHKRRCLRQSTEPTNRQREPDGTKWNCLRRFCAAFM